MDWRDRNPMLDLGKLNHGGKGERQNRPAIIDPQQLGELLRAIDGYKGNVVIVAALPHVFVRPDEFRCVKWREFELDQNIWTIPSGRMKMWADNSYSYQPTGTGDTLGFEAVHA